MSEDQIVQIIGGVSGFFTTAAFFPQAYKVYKTRDTESISLKMFIVLLVGLAGWVVYGFLLQQIPVIVPNIVTFLLATYILVMKLKEKK